MSGMTDAEVIEALERRIAERHEDCRTRKALEHAAARLRGDGEQQAVARPGDECATCKGTGLGGNGFDFCGTCVGAGESYRRYGADRPQPVAVAGDAVRALQTIREVAASVVVPEGKA